MRNTLRTSMLVAALALAGLQSSLASGAEQRVTLSGRNEVPPIDTPASGSGTVTVNDDHTVSAKITVKGMTATAAHIHEGAEGSNGKVIVPLAKSGEGVFSAPAGAKLTDEQYQAYKAGKLYVNVHSARHPGGEVRAQLKGG